MLFLKNLLPYKKQEKKSSSPWVRQIFLSYNTKSMIHKRKKLDFIKI